MICTPEYIEDMVIGFLASEGVIRCYEDIEQICVQGKEGFVHIQVKNVNAFYEEFQSKRYITSCCGKSRQGFVFFNDARMARTIKDIPITVSFEDCFRLMGLMQESATTFAQIAGVHNASLCNKQGIVVSRMDIGRHNALDKIYGHGLKYQSIQDKIIVFSGRILSEILLKVAKIGCGMVLSKSAQQNWLFYWLMI